MESGVFFDALNQGDFQMTLVGWLGFVDPDEWLYNLFHSEGKWNQQSFADEDVDALLEKGKRLVDREERLQVYRQAQSIIAREAPMAFLYVNDLIGANRTRVQDYTPHPTGTIRGLADTWRWEGN
jgi:peptide/nickel transport system substrate-binding protein